MNLGSLPGYYWDAEKRKYFPLLANHVAPEGAKYSRENVKREKEQSRKRRKTAAFQKKKATETVKRSRVLQSSLITGIGLSREHGIASRLTTQEARVAAMGSQFQSSDLLSLKGCESCGKRDTVFDFAMDPATDAIVWGLGSQSFGRIQYLADPQYTHDLAVFSSEISSISVTSQRTVFGTAHTSSHPGNVFIAGLSEPSDDNAIFPIVDSPAPSYLRLGDEDTDLWTSSPNPAGGLDIVAIGGSSDVYMVGSEGTLLQTYHVGADVRCMDWLSPTLAVSGTRRKGVLLFDARAGGSSTRFIHNSGITGVRSLGSGSQILVVGFDGMAVYDVRMPAARIPTRHHYHHHQPPSPALFRMPFKTERPSTALDIYRDASIAAVADDTNVIRLHSLLTGKLIGELGKPDWSVAPNHANPRGAISRMRFSDDGDAKPTLLVSQGPDLREWSWGGMEDDEY
ncbi:hypothetical protein AAFC00_001808 [Neodothiora populina]|uniref:Uncharacterized protein n=1 Tax=Neodothiora populina TaxID=2781224 RepID=A0ABR3PQ73_9PEZI